MEAHLGHVITLFFSFRYAEFLMLRPQDVFTCVLFPQNNSSCVSIPAEYFYLRVHFRKIKIVAYANYFFLRVFPAE